MKSGISKLFLGAILVITIATGIFWFGSSRSVSPGMIILTQVPVDFSLASDFTDIDLKYINDSKIVALNLEAINESPIELTREFAGARSPEVSIDGKIMVFSGRLKEGSTWQIFIKDLASLNYIQVTDFKVNCTDPAWMPDGRIVFSRQDNDMNVPVYRLYAIRTDGSDLKQVTYNVNSNTSSSIFQDGRIFYINHQKSQLTGNPHYEACRTDGTKSELFFRGTTGREITGKSVEAVNGRVYFIEKLINKNEWDVASVSFGNPFNSYLNHSTGIDGAFRCVTTSADGNLYVSYKAGEKSTYGLYQFDSEGGRISDPIYISDSYNIIEVAVVEEKNPAMKLPTIVNEEKETGTLLCHDADFSLISLNEEVGDQETTSVQVFDVNGLISEIPVEEDGSFYIEVAADKPVRFQTINSEGQVLRGPSSWVWVRPGERRSCVGCHEDHQLAPENRVPDAIYAGMHSLPGGTKSEPIVLNEK